MNPVSIDGAHGIVAGHARTEAAVSVGNDGCSYRFDHPSPSQIRAHVI
ncbi:hypothetical protein [Pseudorhodoplanes sp.]